MKKDNEHGQSLVEFALVLPVLVLFLMGIIDFGRIVATHLIVAEAARDVARYASLGDTDAGLDSVMQSDTSVIGSGATLTVNPAGSRTSGGTVSVTVGDSVSIFDPVLALIIGNHFGVQSTVSMRVE